MKTARLAVAALGAFVGGTAVAAPQAAAPRKPAPARQVKVMAPATLKWTPDPESGVPFVVLSGNPKTGPHEAFSSFPAGSGAPLHWHTFSNTYIGVSGTLVIQAEGQEARELTAGAWMLLPGRLNHTTWCKAGTDCVFYARQPGKDDSHLATPAGN
jgi:quercetin dioxygenase-like cupin family protein